jgi:hypothetical protein
MDRRRDKALALILVMTVVLALAIIATPFVLSMILQERTATAARYLSQADYGADGAKNYAMWRLMQSVDYIERRHSGGGASSYYYDTQTEFDIRLDDDIRNRVKISDPKGSIWGLSVQDEQGKLNVRTCGEPALRNLSSMVDGRVINLKDYVTQYSGRDSTWIAPQKIRSTGYQNGTSAGGGITVDNLHLLGPKSRVRASKQGMPPLETEVTANSICGGDGTNGFSTRKSIAGYVGGVVEVEQRHPVNINTAKRETLTAMFEGLNIYGDPSSRVTRGQADVLAARCVGRNFTRLEEFLTAVASAPLGASQKLAVLINCVCPNAALLNGSGTAPICVKSYDVYTLEAFASMNNPAGTEVAGRGYREVVSVSPPMDLMRLCESQYDFNQMMSQLQVALQATNPKLSFPGYPYGNLITSYPRKPTDLADVSLRSKDAYITVTPATDERGQSIELQYEQELQGWPDPHNRNHYKDELDGKKMGGAESYPWRQFFALNHTPEDDLTPGQERSDTGSGGFEVWAKLDGGGDVTIFDIQEAPTTNRVSLKVEGGELVLTAADATIPYSGDPSGRIANGVAEIRWPGFKVTPDTWTHFAAYWKTNRYADLAMLVDGFSDPQAKFMHYTAPGGQELMTKLSSAMTPTSTNLTLKNAGILPSGNEPTPLLIGEEVVLYDGSNCLRGQRGTTATDHQSQVNVSLFGYSSKIKAGTITVPMGPLSIRMTYDRIPRTNATSTYSFGPNPMAQVAGDKQNPGPPPRWEITATENQIGVTLPPGAAITDFPDHGYITVNDEIVFYTGRSKGGTGGGMPPSTDKFTGCVRGQFGTPAALHPSGSPIHLWSVAATNANNYPCPLGATTDGTIIQIGDEWFGPVRPFPNAGETFWVSYVNGTKPVPLQRGTMGTARSAHSPGDPVIPTFLAIDVNTWPSKGYSVGAHDRVTLTDAQNQKQTAKVRHAGPPAPPNQVPNWGSWTVTGGNPPAKQIVALYDHAQRDWVADDRHVRLLKFPSGELLSRAWLDTSSPQVTIGPWGGQIDELKAFASTKGRIRLQMPAGVSGNLQPQHTYAPIRPNGGLLKIGDEYVGYGHWDNPDPGPGTISQTKRGWLNSNAELHDAGAPVFFLQWVPVAVLGADITAQDNVLHLRDKLAGDEKRYLKGYVLVENEMMLFEWNAGNGMTLSMPTKWDNQSGLYRGMFGTPAVNHTSGTLVYGMPYRFYDTYKEREFDNTMLYYQFSTKMELAHWRWFKWTQEIPTGDDKIEIHAIARVDGKGEFWDPPGMNDHIQIIDTTASGTNVRVNRTGYQHEAGQFDIRFYVKYKQGAFDATMPRTAESWKRVPKIRDIQVDYDRPSQTLHHEDR